MLFPKPSSTNSWLWTCIVFLHIYGACAQLTPEEWEPLLNGLHDRPVDLAERVPLMTNDTVKIPLVDLQVFAPPSTGIGSDGNCTVALLEHSFGVNSFNVPAIVDYVPPSGARCGEAGTWAGINLNLTVYWSAFFAPIRKFRHLLRSHEQHRHSV